jgi:hypothetical protein
VSAAPPPSFRTAIGGCNGGAVRPSVGMSVGGGANGLVRGAYRTVIVPCRRWETCFDAIQDSVRVLRWGWIGRSNWVHGGGGGTN